MRSGISEALSRRRSRARRGFRTGAGVAVLALAVTGVAPVVLAPSARAGVSALHGTGPATAPAARTSASADLTTAHNDPTASFNKLRNGWDRFEPGLSPSVVGAPSFGEVFSTPVNGQVYAQPLVVGSTVIVATENDWVYGLDAATGSIEWSTSLGTPYAIPNCRDLVPNIGVTSTPVYDAKTGSVYVMASIMDPQVTYHLFGLSVQTGAITLDQEISGSPANDPNITFQPADQGQRAGLLLLNGFVYASFGSHCDNSPWTGFVARINVTSGKSTLWTDEAGVTDDEAGIWQAGGGLMSDGPGRIIVTSGNGISPPVGPGGVPPGQLGDSVIRLAPQTGGSLAAKDFFSPANAPALDSGDLDFGSGGPAGLPVGTTVYPHILVQGGKVGVIFLLDRDNLGGREQGPGGTDGDLFQSQAYGGVWGHPAVFERSTSALPPGSSGLKDYVYSVGRADYMRAFQISTDSTGLPVLSNVANSTFTFGFSSGSPVVTSAGVNASSAVVWCVDSSGGSGANASLVAFDAVPQPATGGGLDLAELGQWPIGTAAKFTIPATSNGMVYVGTRDGHLLGFGVTAKAALHRGAAARFGDTAVGSAATRAATVTAVRTVTVTGAALSAADPGPFTVGPVTETVPGSTKRTPVKFPVTLHAGDELHAPVKFAPTAPGGATGAVTFTVSGRAAPTVIPLIGAGTRTGLYATAPRLAMLLNLNDGTNVGPVPVGQPVYAVTTIVNGGTTPQRLTRISKPGGPFTARNLPRAGTVLKPGQSFTVQISYRPGRVGTRAAALMVTGSSGTRAIVSISGKARTAVSKFTAPRRVSFGTVAVGHTVTRFVHIVNVGNQNATVARTRLAGPFHAPYKVAQGLPVNGGYDLSIPITFTPSAPGRTTGRYTFTWRDRLGRHTLAVPITGTGTAQ
jgi:Abnormal spindle-like microcephaly-assoc'd, ASPM-SPD-2-Hydin/PQQ-like domain/HYDIN/CFA65/VesB-like, Ig-like domain